MEHECGAPAFDNIDDVLADRIVNHSRTHSDRTGSPPSEKNVNARPGGTRPSLSPTPESSGTLKRVLIAVAVIVFAYLFLTRIAPRTRQR